ncbi:SDR family oxidoreductase [bacterium]|nr:SDR family oxidoreductase [bacterium]
MSASRLPRGVIWITGASSGIGKAAALRLVKRGWRIAASARNEAALQDLHNQHAEIRPYPLDVANAEQRVRVYQQIREELGPIDILINNAGFAVRGAVEEIPLTSVRSMYDTNVFAPLSLTQAVLPEMRERGEGRIIMVSSLLGKVSMPLNGIYASTKFALEGLSDSLRVETSQWGVKTIIVEPGPIATEFASRAKAVTTSGIDLENSPYKNNYEKFFSGKMLSPSQFWGASTVASAIVDACENPNPKTRYPVHTYAVWLPILAKFLPAKLFDKIIGKRLGF